MAVHRGGETASPQRCTSYDGPMELGVSASLRSDLARRAAPICCGAAAGRRRRVRCHARSELPAGSPFPACTFHQIDRAVVPGMRSDPGHLSVAARPRRRRARLQHLHAGRASPRSSSPGWAGCGCRGAGPPLRVPPWAGTRVGDRPDRRCCIVYGVLRNVPVRPLRAPGARNTDYQA